MTNKRKKKRTRREKILDLLYQRQHVLYEEHERVWLAIKLDEMFQKEIDKIIKNIDNL